MISLRMVFDFRRAYFIGRNVGETLSNVYFGGYSTMIDLLIYWSCFGSGPVLIRDYNLKSLNFSLGDCYYSANLTFFFISRSEFLEDVLLSSNSVYNFLVDFLAYTKAMRSNSFIISTLISRVRLPVELLMACLNWWYFRCNFMRFQLFPKGCPSSLDWQIREY